MATESNPISEMLLPPPSRRLVLHVCGRETLRPLRDQVLRISGFDVDSTRTPQEGLEMFWTRPYDLVLIDVESAAGISAAEGLCSGIKQAQPEQLVAFVCNWRVALLTDCPDEILRTEFDPEQFISGIACMIPSSSSLH